MRVSCAKFPEKLISYSIQDLFDKYGSHRILVRYDTSMQDDQGFLSTGDFEKLPQADPNAPRIEGYQFLRPLGSGGMGSVWLAQEKTDVQRIVAIKMVQAVRQNSEIIARFDAERQAIAMMSHPNIAQLYDTGITDTEMPYFVMEWVDGLPLTTYCDDHRLKIRDRIELFTKICLAVQHAHQKGIVHRDLKPLNLLVTDVDGVPEPKIIDFGLAKAIGDNLKLSEQTFATEHQQFLGTALYSSPEQARSARDIDTRTDVYSLGVILYELLCGKTPIPKDRLEEKPLVEALQLIQDFQPQRPSLRISEDTRHEGDTASVRAVDTKNLQKEISQDLDWIVLRAIEHEPARRYETASELAKELQRYLDGVPVEARPPSVRYRISKFTNRNRGLVAAVAAVAVALILGMFGTTWFAISANFQRNQADKNSKLAKQETNRATAEAKKANYEKGKAKIAESEKGIALARSNYLLGVSRFESNQIAEATRILTSIPEENRKFEWYFALQLMDSSLHTLWGQNEVVAVEPIGQKNLICTGRKNGEIKIWDLRSGKVLKSWKAFQLSLVAIDTSLSGNRIIASGYDFDLKPVVKIWDGSGKEISQIPGLKEIVWDVKFSPDGNSIAIIEVNSFRVFSFSTLKEIHQKKIRYVGPERKICFSPDGKWIATAGGSSLTVWDLRRGSEVFSFNHGNYVQELTFSPDGKYLATASLDGKIRIFDWQRKGIKQLIDTRTGECNGVRFSPDGTLLVSASANSPIQIWDVESGQLLETGNGHLDSVSSTVFFDYGRRIASASRDGTVKIWSVQSRAGAKTFWQGTSGTNKVTYSSSGKYLAAQTAFDTLTIWDVETSKLVANQKLKSRIFDFEFSKDESAIFIANGSNSSFAIFDIESKKVKTETTTVNQVIRVKGESIDNFIALGPEAFVIKDGVESQLIRTSKRGSLYGFEDNPDAKKVITFGGNQVQIWKRDSGELDSSFVVGGENAYVDCVAWNATEGLLATAGRQRIGLWKIREGDDPVLVKYLEGHGSVVTSVSFDSSGERLISASLDRTVRVWDTTTGDELLKVRTGESHITSISFHPRKPMFTTGSSEGKIQQWNALPRKEYEKIQLTTAKISKIEFDESKNTAFAIDKEGQLVVFDTQKKQIVCSPKARASAVCASMFRGYVLAGYSDNTVRIWRVSDGALRKSIPVSTFRIHDVRFDPSTSKLVVVNPSGKKFNFDVDELSSAKEIDSVERQPGFRFLPFGKEVLVLKPADLAFSPNEADFSRANFHRSEADKNLKKKNYFAATFHLAALLAKQESDQKVKTQFIETIELVKKEAKTQGKKQIVLHPIVLDFVAKFSVEIPQNSAD